MTISFLLLIDEPPLASPGRLKHCPLSTNAISSVIPHPVVPSVLEVFLFFLTFDNFNIEKLLYRGRFNFGIVGQFLNIMTFIQGGPVLNVSNSPFISPSKKVNIHYVIFLKNASQGKYSR